MRKDYIHGADISEKMMGTTMAPQSRLKSLGLELAKCRLQGTLTDHDLDAEIADLAQALIVQSAAAAAYPSRQNGYKIGATSPQAQKLVGCDSPFFAPMFERDRIEPDTTLSMRPGLMAVECEFAFKMGHNYPANGAPVDRETIADAVASCHPALEIIGRRTPGEGLPSLINCTADLGLNAGFIPGAPIADWQGVDLAAAEVRGLVNGTVTNQGIGENVLGHPLNALTWIAETLAKSGGRLNAGDWVSSGTCLGIIPITPGATITGDFGALGSVSVTFT
jgi:2-keto-4-pentenoate hydratase